MPVTPQDLLRNPGVLLRLKGDPSTRTFYPYSKSWSLLIGIIALKSFEGKARRPETLDPKNATHILYSSAVDDEHFIPHYGGTLAGLGNLSRSTFEQLKLVAANLQTKAEKYWTDNSFPKKIPMFASILGVVKLYLETFECLPMTHRQVHFAFTKLQCFMLEFIGAYHWLYIYQPRMAGVVEPASKPSHAVGAFISSLTDCDALFWAGIPVWLSIQST